MANSGTYWAGFDLGGTKMYGAIFDDEEFKIRGKERKKTKASEGVEACIDRIIETISDAIKDAGIDKKDIKGIGASVPGMLDLNKGIVISAPNLTWKKVPIKDELEKKFNCPVFISNDVDAGVYGEYCFGAGKGARCVVGVFPGTGIGGGCVYQGQLIRGLVNSCMEIGHITVLPNGPLCGCGKRGCLETVASRLAIAQAAAAAAYRGEAPALLKSAGTDLSNIRSGALADAIKDGDQIIESIVKEAARWLGVGIASAINLLAPDTVVLGGGLVEAMPELYQREVSASVKESVVPSFIGVSKIAIAKLGDDATVTGAAAWARKCVVNGAQ
jgi:glucokinase